MLLSINSQKIEVELKKNPLAYTVVSYNLEAAPIAHDLPTAEVHGTLSVIPPDVEKARGRVLALRQQIIDSGRQPLSPDELEREIAEARGR